MANPKIVDGRVAYLMETYDGSYVAGSMSEAEANVFLKNAKTDPSIAGYELVSGKYHFQTDVVVLKLKSKKQQED